MEPTPKQQAVNLIGRSERILITPGKPDGDAIGSGIAMLLILESLGKKVELVINDTISSSYSFLPSFDRIKPELAGTKEFVISLNNPQVEADKLSYNIQDGRLNIIITPKKGNYSPSDVTFTEGSFQ